MRIFIQHLPFDHIAHAAFNDKIVHLFATETLRVLRGKLAMSSGAQKLKKPSFDQIISEKCLEKMMDISNDFITSTNRAGEGG